jgi:hypothetical protein
METSMGLFVFNDIDFFPGLNTTIWSFCGVYPQDVAKGGTL